MADSSRLHPQRPRARLLRGSAVAGNARVVVTPEPEGEVNVQGAVSVREEAMLERAGVENAGVEVSVRVAGNAPVVANVGGQRRLQSRQFRRLQRQPRSNNFRGIRGQATRTPDPEEMFIVQCSIVICHRWWRSAQLFIKDAAPKAHPKMTNDN